MLPVGCVPPALYHTGGGESLPRETPPWTENPPGRNMGPETEIPLERTRDQAARQEVTSYKDPPRCGQTNASENNSLSQTWFTGGNNDDTNNVQTLVDTSLM